MRVTIRAWNKAGYHKDIAYLDEQQVRMHHVVHRRVWNLKAFPIDAIRLVVDPNKFPEMVEFEVIVEQ